jgi:hypothetical protein
MPLEEQCVRSTIAYLASLNCSSDNLKVAEELLLQMNPELVNNFYPIMSDHMPQVNEAVINEEKICILTANLLFQCRSAGEDGRPYPNNPSNISEKNEEYAARLQFQKIMIEAMIKKFGVDICCFQEAGRIKEGVSLEDADSIEKAYQALIGDLAKKDEKGNLKIAGRKSCCENPTQTKDGSIKESVTIITGDKVKLLEVGATIPEAKGKTPANTCLTTALQVGDEQLVLFNNHGDYGDPESLNKISAEIAVARVPVIVTGDFNWSATHVSSQEGIKVTQLEGRLPTVISKNENGLITVGDHRVSVIDEATGAPKMDAKGKSVTKPDEQPSVYDFMMAGAGISGAEIAVKGIYNPSCRVLDGKILFQDDARNLSLPQASIKLVEASSVTRVNENNVSLYCLKCRVSMK